jgi:V8-like Glu-specific endopeptidase
VKCAPRILLGAMNRARAALVGLAVLVMLALPAAAVAQTPRGAQSVFPGDGRVQVTNVGAYPWRALVYLEDRTFFGLQADGGWCSGAFVGPNVILTAAHCLYDRDRGWVASIRAVPGKNGGAEPWGSQFVSRFVVPNEWVTIGGPDYDYGIAVMPDTTLGARVGWFQMAALTDATLARSDLVVALTAYSGDKPSGTLWHEAQSGLALLGSTQLFYWLSMRPGASGGPVWRTADQSIVAINTYERLASVTPKIPDSTRPNFGRRVDAGLVSSVTGWCVVYACTPAWTIETAPTTLPTAVPTTTPPPIATSTPPPTTAPPTVAPVATSLPSATATPRPAPRPPPIWRVLVPVTAR